MPGVKKHYAQQEQHVPTEPETIPLIHISPTVQRRTSTSFLLDPPSSPHLLEPKSLKRSSSAPPESDDIERLEDQESPSLPPIFSCSSQYSLQDSSITMMRNTGDKKITIYAPPYPLKNKLRYTMHILY